MTTLPKTLTMKLWSNPATDPIEALHRAKHLVEADPGLEHRMECVQCGHVFDPIKHRWLCPECKHKNSCCEGAPL